MTEVGLRPREAYDDDFLYALYCDPVVRRQSRDRYCPGVNEFRAWIRDKEHVYIAVHRGISIGYGRITLTHGVAEISYALTPTARGRGWGIQLIAQLSDLSRDLGASEVQAYVRTTNTPSMASLLQLGFVADAEDQFVLLHQRNRPSSTHEVTE